MKTDDLKFMKKALAMARTAGRRGEVPVAALLVLEGKVIARAGNRTKTDADPTAHAEILTLRSGARRLKNERLLGTELYVTKEPCAMCAGAIVQARVARVVFGCRDKKAGACGGALRVLPHKKLNHRPTVAGGVRAEESARILKSFFRRRR